MKRRIPVFLAAVVASTVVMLAPSPTHAHNDACSIDRGVINLSLGFGLPGNWRSTGYTLSVSSGVCASGTTLTASGTVNGACGESSGHGLTNANHRFAFVVKGGTLSVTGDVTGTVAVQPNVGCTTGSASTFDITGSVTLTHSGCTVRATMVQPNYYVYACN